MNNTTNKLIIEEADLNDHGTWDWSSNKELVQTK